MNRFVRVLALTAAVCVWTGAAPAWAQEPGVDDENCKESKLLSRMPGCGIFECSSKEFDAAELVVNMKGETKSLEGAVEYQKLICPAKLSPLQLARNVEAALKKAGYAVTVAGRVEGYDHPVVAAQKGAQWVGVQTNMFNEFPMYEMTAVLVKGMEQQMDAGAQAIVDAINASGRLDLYGITFATGQTTITPASNQVLGDVLAVLNANPDWKLRIEGHTDNVGNAAANQKLSEGRAAAVVAWLTGKGIAASRLTAAGLGATQPVADNATEDGRAKNRRVVLVKQ